MHEDLLFHPNVPLVLFYVISQNKVKCQQISPVEAHLYTDLRWSYNVIQMDLEKWNKTLYHHPSISA